METQTQAIDRLLEVLAPALKTEMERAIEEAQRQLETEFQNKLETAIAEAEALSNQAVEQRVEQAITATRESVRREVTEELQARFNATLKETTERLEAAQRDELQRFANVAEQWRVRAEAQREFTESASQSEMLVRFLNSAERFAPSVAVYVAKADALALWKARGSAQFPETVSQGTSRPDFFFRPVNVRDKVLLAVCAQPPVQVDVLDFLTQTLQRSIELFALRLRTSPAPPSAPEKVREPETPPVATHDAALKMARNLVSQIKTQHEDQVRYGREDENLYERLQNQIERSRAQYRHRISTEILRARDYFHEELVRVLADNVSSRLGTRYPGPVLG